MVAGAEAMCRHDAGELGRSLVERSEGDRPLAAVLGREDDGDPFRVGLGDPVDLRPEGDSRRGTSPFPARCWMAWENPSSRSGQAEAPLGDDVPLDLAVPP